MQVFNYFSSLVITIVIELCVALLFGYRSEAAWKTVILMNLMTHPPLTYILWINSYAEFADAGRLLIILEIMVVFVEWGILYYVMREKARRLLCLSFAANASSFGIGLIFFEMPKY
jgi:hypothetical protein